MNTKKNIGIILAAGNSRRINSKTSKVFHDLCGKPVIQHVMDNMKSLYLEDIIIVASEQSSQHELYKNTHVCIQEKPNGTAGAVQVAFERILPLHNIEYVFIACGDAPLFTKDNLQKLFDSTDDITFAIAKLPDEQINNPYGRVIFNSNNQPLSICEFKDADDITKKSPWINAGFYKIKKDVLQQLLPLINNNNASSEYYLTDIVALAKNQNMTSSCVKIPFEDTLGINTRQDLEASIQILQQRYKNIHRANGVTFINEHTTYVSFDTIIGQDTIIEPNVFIGTGVTINDRVLVKSFSYLADCNLQNDVHVGPFAHIRGNSVMMEKSEIGNFVELKNTVMKRSAKAKHLTYLGDATIGEKTNIGAGTITANYDGFFKHKTVVGNDVNIGASTVFIAPVNVANDSMTAAGTVLFQDLEAGALAIARTQLKIKEGWATQYRAKMKTLKNSKDTIPS